MIIVRYRFVPLWHDHLNLVLREFLESTSMGVHVPLISPGSLLWIFGVWVLSQFRVVICSNQIADADIDALHFLIIFTLTTPRSCALPSQT